MNPASHPFNDELTTAESEVLNFLFRGLTTEEIAAATGRAFKTVEHHLSSMLWKTGTRNSRELIYEALERGWLAVPLMSVTKKQNEVLNLLFKGLTTSEIAESFCKAPKSVEKRISAMMQKAGSRNSRGLIYTALWRGILTPPLKSDKR